MLVYSVIVTYERHEQNQFVSIKGRFLNMVRIKKSHLSKDSMHLKKHNSMKV